MFLTTKDKGMEEEKILLELTPGEVLMLQELTGDMDAMYVWMRRIAESLREKALEAYIKPVISHQEYTRRLEEVRKLWWNQPAEEEMVQAEKVELRFCYQVEG